MAAAAHSLPPWSVPLINSITSTNPFPTLGPTRTTWRMAHKSRNYLCSYIQYNCDSDLAHVSFITIDPLSVIAFLYCLLSK